MSLVSRIRRLMPRLHRLKPPSEAPGRTKSPMKRDPSAPSPEPVREDSRRWAAFRVTVKRSLLALLGLSFALPALVLLALWTQAGRDLILDFALGFVNDAIPGRLDIAEYRTLSLDGLELRGVSIFDPAGKEVAAVQTLRIEADVLKLRPNAWRLRRVELRAGFVDISKLNQGRRGLLAAFVDPDAPPSAPSEGPLPYVRIDRIALDAITLVLPGSAATAPTHIRNLKLSAAFELDRTPRAHVEKLTFDLDRGADRLATLSRFEGLLGRGSEPSSASLSANLSGAKLEFTGKGLLPSATGWKTAPVQAHLILSKVTARSLAHLARDKSLDEAFSGAIELDLLLSGSINQLESRLALRSPAGSIEWVASLHALRELEFALVTPGVTLARAIPGAPDSLVAGRIVGQVDLRNAPEGAVVKLLRVTEASVDGAALPEIEAAGTVSKQGVEQLTLKLQDQVSKLEASGHADFDGAFALDVSSRLESTTLQRLLQLYQAGPPVSGSLRARLKVRRSFKGDFDVAGELSGRELKYDDISLQSFDSKVKFAGGPTDFAGVMETKVRGLRAGDLAVQSAALSLRGGPERYTATVRALSNQGDVKLALKLTRDGRVLVVEATGTGKRDGHVVELNLAETRVSPGGELESEGLAVAAAGQTLQIRGSVTAEDSALLLEARDLDLSVLGQFFPSKPPLAGKATLRAELRGRLDRPDVNVSIKANGIRVGDRPNIDLWVQGRLDVQGGRSELSLGATDQVSPPRRDHRLNLKLKAQAQFSPEEALSRILEAAEYRVRLEVAQLDLSFAQDMLPGSTLPASGRLHADAELAGTLSTPKLAFNLGADLMPAWSDQTLRVVHELHLVDQQLETQLRIRDKQGDWLQLTAATSLPPLAELLRHPEELAQRERWRIDATLAERNLRALPLPPLENLPPATVRASLGATHNPGQEPKANLTVALRQKQAVPAQAECSAKDLRMDARLALRQGRLSFKVLGEQARRELMKLEATADLRLSRALAGGQPEIGTVSARLSSGELELGDLPWVCQRYTGRVNVEGKVDDLLGRQPTAELALHAINLSAGSRARVNAKLNLSLRSDRATINASVRHGANNSTATAQVAIRAGGGQLTIDKNAPVHGKVHLRHLPIGPFFDPSGAISYATGTLSGDVQLAGRLKHPKVKGTIDLEQLGFTITETAQPLRKITGRVTFTETQVALDDFAAQDRDGVLRIDGQVDFEDPKRVDGDFKLHAREFPVRQLGQVVATTDVDARVSAVVTPKKTRVKVLLHRVDTWLESSTLRKGMLLSEHDDVIIDGVPANTPNATQSHSVQEKNTARIAKTTNRNSTKNAPTEGEQAPSRRVTEIVIKATDKFWVKRDDFAVKLSTLLKASIDGETVKVEGKVELDRGYIQLLGKVFEIQRGGSLEFIGSRQPDPVLAIEAHHENRHSGETVKVRITGRGSAPELSFFVDERAVTAGAAFVVLFGSQSSSESPDTAGNQARSFVGGLTAGILATAARRELGAAAPIIMVEPGDEGQQTRVRAGFELDSLVPKFLRNVATGVYVEGIVANEQEASTQDANVHGGALVEIYFPWNLFTAGQYGPDSTWSVDVGWQL